jgi:ketosteroid isomerase-like protein
MATAAVEHPNVTLFRRGYEAFNNGDMDTVRSQLADNVVWHTTGRGRFTGDTRGIDETLGLFLELAQVTNGTLRFEVHDILANDTHGVALVTTRWELDGKLLEDKGVHVVHIEEGKTTESWFFDWNPYLFDELFPAQA